MLSCLSKRDYSFWEYLCKKNDLNVIKQTITCKYTYFNFFYQLFYMMDLVEEEELSTTGTPYFKKVKIKQSFFVIYNEYKKKKKVKLKV